MFKMNNMMVACVLNSLRSAESTAYLPSAINTSLTARIYTGGDLTVPEEEEFENAPAGAALYQRNYASAIALLNSNRTLLATQTSSVAAQGLFQNFGTSPEKSVWRLSQFPMITFTDAGTAGLLVLDMNGRICHTFTMGALESGADIELTEATYAIGATLILNDVKVEYLNLK